MSASIISSMCVVVVNVNDNIIMESPLQAALILISHKMQQQQQQRLIIVIIEIVMSRKPGSQLLWLKLRLQLRLRQRLRRRRRLGGALQCSLFELPVCPCRLNASPDKLSVPLYVYSCCSASVSFSDSMFAVRPVGT
ncbi:hypothetical protein AWZ03_008008 [Drosophila navojoa]|uniref:Uncharacterized protein n=1 Tax=Drosophila navojoa TaxID=7232 RepID=A0A484B9N1_DRONA|nr:hypothetical protein AWZ03_008008 [Drosophila navojoa]